MRKICVRNVVGLINKIIKIVYNIAYNLFSKREVIKMEKYKHQVQYYETDKMGITHHSNYIRWMEEARIDFLREIGWDYKRLESLGMISPVMEVNCKYKATTTFEDMIEIEVFVKELKGIRLYIGYKMTNSEGKVVCEAESMHCFLSAEGRPISLQKQFPEFYDVLCSYAKAE